MLPEEFLYQLSQANPIESVVSSYVPLVRTGSRLKCQCPFHSEKTPSCVIYPENNSFYCFGCHVGGTVITFIQKIEGVGFMDAVQILAERAGLTVPQNSSADSGETKRRLRLLELNRAAARYYYNELTGKDKRGLLYLKERALKPEIIKKYGLGFASDRWDGLLSAMRAQGYTDEELITANLCSRSAQSGNLYDRFRNRVIFPIFDLKGSVIAFGGRTIEKDGTPKYLNSSDTPVFKKGRNLFSMNFAKKSQSKRLILAEGYMDVIAIHQGGFDNVVASLGTALTPDQCRLMRQYAEEVVISYDSDAAGQNATVKAVNLLRAVGLRPKILHIENAKDPDEYLKKYGSSFFRKLLEDAEDAVTYELERCRDGTDAATEDGTITALHKAVSVLSGIDNELDRNVYLSKIAKEYEVQPEILRAQVEREIRKKRSGEKKQAWRAIQLAPSVRDPVNPEASANPGAAKAETLILCYLFRHPDMLRQVQEYVSPEDFVTALHRRIYTQFAEKIEEGIPFSLSMFAEDFTPDEMGRITGIQAENREIDISEQSVADAAETLRKKKTAAADAADMDDASFADMMQQLRAKKT